MKDIFFSAIFLLTFFSCSEEQPNDALSYNDIGATPSIVSKAVIKRETSQHLHTNNKKLSNYQTST